MTDKICLLLFSLLISLVGSAQWQQVKSIEGGNVLDLERIDNTIWAASYGGLFKSPDEGQTWVSDESFPASWSVLDISVIEEDIYLMLYESTPFAHDVFAVYVYRSRNGGASWERKLAMTESGLSSAYEVFRIDAALFVISGTRLIISEDDGVSWDDVNYFENKYIGFPFALAHDDSNILVTTYWGLYLSEDLGQTWDSLGPYNFSTTPIVEDSLIIVADYHILLSSHDLGQSWEELPLPNDYCTIQRSTSGKLYAKDNLLYVSEDNGVSWDTLNTEYYSVPVDLLELPFDELLIATEHGFYVTGQQGALWHESNAGFVAAYILSLFVSPSGEYFASTNLGAMRSADGTQSWTPWELSQSSQPLQIIWIADDSAFIRTVTRLYLATNDMQEYKNVTPVGGVAEHLEIGDDVLYLYDWVEEVIWKSPDFGMTWDALELPFEDVSETFTVIGPIIIAIESYEHIWQSPDGGVTWEEAYEADFPGVAYSMIHQVGGRILLTNSHQWLFSDTDGASWQLLNPQGLPIEYPDVLSLISVDSVLFAVIPANGVYVSFDKGTYWEPFNEGLETLRGRSLTYANGILALGTSHGSIWLRDITGTLNVSAPEVIQQLFIHPMPVQQSFDISLPESVHGMTRLELYDSNGQNVYSASMRSVYGTLPNAYVDLAAGFYLARLTYEQQNFVGKVVVMH